MKRGTKILLWILLTALLAAGAILLLAIPTSEPKPFTKEELTLLENLGASTNRIRIGNIPESRPLDFQDDKTGLRTGLTWDYIALLEQKLGLEFQHVECDNWEEDLLNHRIDLIGSIQDTDERAEHFRFSEPYAYIPIVIFAQKDSEGTLYLEEMDGDTLAVVKDSYIHNNLRKLQDQFPQKYRYHLVPMNNVPEGLVAVSEGVVDAIVTDIAVTRVYMSKLDIDLRKAGEIPQYQWQLRFASNTNSPLPMDLVDKALGMITEQEEQLIQSRWPYLTNKATRAARFLTVFPFFVIIPSICISILITLVSIGPDTRRIPKLHAKYISIVVVALVGVPLGLHIKKIADEQSRAADASRYAGLARKVNGNVKIIRDILENGVVDIGEVTAVSAPCVTLITPDVTPINMMEAADQNPNQLDVRLTAIYWSPTDPLVTIDNENYRVGDKVQGFKILEIRQTEVVFRSPLGDKVVKYFYDYLD